MISTLRVGCGIFLTCLVGAPMALGAVEENFI